MYKRQHGFSGHLGQLAALSSLPGDSPTASSALPATKSAPEKLLRTCRQDKTGAGKEEDEGGLAPTEDDDAASRFKFQTMPLYHNGLPIVIEDGTDYYK